jgi:hypothetical protein
MGQVLKGTVNTSTTEIRILEGRLHRNMTDDFSVTNLAEVRKGNMRIMFHAFNSNRKKAPKRKRGKEENCRRQLGQSHPGSVYVSR